MIKQSTLAMAFTTIAVISTIPHTSIATGVVRSPFADPSLIDIRPDEKRNWRYQKPGKKIKKPRRRKKSRSSTAPTNEVKLQKALRSAGYYDEKFPLNGKLNSPESESAIEQYQHHYGLPATGALSPDVKEVLLQQGKIAGLLTYLNYVGDSQRNNAKRLQAALTVHGFYTSTIDGSFGEKSRAAMREYQQENNLGPTGELLSEEEDELVSDSIEILQNQHTQTEQALAEVASALSQSSEDHSAAQDEEEGLAKSEEDSEESSPTKSENTAEDLVSEENIIAEMMKLDAGENIFSDKFISNDTDGIYADIPFNLQDDSTISLEYHSECKNQESSYFDLYTSWQGRAISVITSEVDQPYGPLPLVKGKYSVRLGCKGEGINQQKSVDYNLKMIVKPISTSFSPDQEPDATENNAIELTATQSFDGRLGFGGYDALQDDIWSDSGIDDADTYFFHLKKGTKLQFKLEYDNNFIDNPFFGDANGDVQLLIYYLKNGDTKFVHNFHIWTNSGDSSEKITVKENGLFKIVIRGGYSTALRKTNFGGYRLTALISTH